MGFLSYLRSPFSFLLIGLAIVHFIRRRPDTYWLFIILFLGPLGAIIYLAVEALPDIGLLGQSFKVFPRRKRIRELEAAIRDNPSAGNYEELGGLYMDDGNFATARAAFDKAISARADTLDPFYRRGVCALQLSRRRRRRARSRTSGQSGIGLRFSARRRPAGPRLCADRAERKSRSAVSPCDRHVNALGNLSQFRGAIGLQGHNAEAREWAQKVLEKKPTMPGYLRRRERPWFRRANDFLKRVRA